MIVKNDITVLFLFILFRKTVAWTHVEAASMYPQIMKYLPTLLPGQFMDIISDGKMKNSQDTTEETSQQQSNSDVLENLEELIKTDVWKLGFNNVSTNCLFSPKPKYYQLCGIFLI